MGGALSRRMEAIDAANQQLLDAAEAGDLPVVRTALRNGARIHRKRRRGRWRRRRLLAALLQGDDRGAPLAAACAGGHFAVARFLLEQGADPNGPSLDNWPWVDTALHRASAQGHLHIVRLLLEANAEVNGGDSCHHKNRGDTPLHRAAAQGHLSVVEELLQRGAELTNVVDGIRNTHKTPLDLAKSAGHDRVAVLLLRHYRELVHKREGPLSLHAILRKASYAYSRVPQGGGILFKVQLPVGELSKAEMVELLRGFVEQDPTTLRARSGTDGALPIHVAVRQPKMIEEVTRFLVEQQNATTLHVPTKDGALPIHHACKYRASIATIKMLVANGGGADSLSVRDNHGDLPVHLLLCRSSNPVPPPQLASLECLLDAFPGAAAAPTKNGQWPVMLSCEKSSLNVIYVLVRRYPNFVFPTAVH